MPEELIIVWHSIFVFFEKIVHQFSWMPIFFIVLMIISYSWHWAVAINLQDKLPEHLKINTTKYKMVFVFYLLVSILLPLGAFWFVGQIFSGDVAENIKLYNFESIQRLRQEFNKTNSMYSGSFDDFNSGVAIGVNNTSSQNQQALQWAKSNPDDPRSGQILNKLGVQ